MCDEIVVDQYLSNGKFKTADHQAVVNSNYSRLSIATFQNPSQEAIVYPLKLEEGEECFMEEPITFAQMYSRKMSRDIELARQKKLAKLAPAPEDAPAPASARSMELERCAGLDDSYRALTLVESCRLHHRCHLYHRPQQ